MTSSAPPTAAPSSEPDAASSPSALVPISRGELAWLTAGMWLGGVSMLTLLPVLLVTQLGLGEFVGVVGSYFFFFLAWQPIQTITQRALGTRAALFRMLLLVITAFSVAFVMKVLLFGPEVPPA
jgi:hypothetical protein